MTTRTITTITAEDIDTHREVLCAWATANGIEPEDVVARTGMTIQRTGRRTVIVYHQFQRSQDGKILFDDDAQAGLMIRMAVPLVETLAQHGYPASDPETQVGDGE
ncbi:hypothetical protein ACIOKD_14285 [Streptomyces sp. NPDC087844]|uniref:hypothetical protein n=1 Tax=Streptomyces sp. NPDC087844 TaxID=3365805 RepID=UPI0037F151FA